MAPVTLNDEVAEFSEETREATPANFLMKIESFSLLGKRGINKYESRPFDAGGYKWKLIMNFEGEDKDEDEGGHVSVYLSIAETDSLPEGWEVNTIFTFFMHNQLLDYYQCFRGRMRRVNAVNHKWGFSKLICNKNLIDPSKGYVVDDGCVFGAEVLVIKTERANECLSLTNDTSLYKREWKLSEFSKLEKVWNSEEFIVGDHYWKVTLYPKGNGSPAKDRYISIYVECVDAKRFAPHHKVKADITMRIKSNLNDNHHSQTFDHNWFTSASTNWGYDDFIAIADMSSRGFLVDDCCFLEVEITVQALALDAPKI